MTTAQQKFPQTEYTALRGSMPLSKKAMTQIQVGPPLTMLSISAVATSKTYLKTKTTLPKQSFILEGLFFSEGRNLNVTINVVRRGQGGGGKK